MGKSNQEAVRDQGPQALWGGQERRGRLRPPFFNWLCRIDVLKGGGPRKAQSVHASAGRTGQELGREERGHLSRVRSDPLGPPSTATLVLLGGRLTSSGRWSSLGSWRIPLGGRPRDRDSAAPVQSLTLRRQEGLSSHNRSDVRHDSIQELNLRGPCFPCVPLRTTGHPGALDNMASPACWIAVAAARPGFHVVCHLLISALLFLASFF